jgi:hypothetical protein
MGEDLYYHFISSMYATEDIENQRLKVSLINTLNDPFELLPYLRYPFPQRQKYHLLRRTVAKKYGLLCFSKTWEEPLLWSHYAEKHKGVALGFKIPEGKYRPFKVRYSSEPLRQQIELTDNPDTNEQLFLKLAEVKYIAWAYEKEWRILIPLKDCTQIGEHYFVPFDSNIQLTEIVIGCLCDMKGVSQFTSLGKKCNFRVIRTRLQWQGYKILPRN